MIIASSCSKNLGLYRERTGATVFIGENAACAEALASQAATAARKIYSVPPAHGAILAGMIFSDHQLNTLWRSELGEMCQRINGLRAQLDERLSPLGDFSFIRQEKGMFSFLGLSEQQVITLREEHSVYMIGNSRVNIAGVNESNIDSLVTAVAAVV